jgi:predicted alpha/beta hydrolase family esterase
MDTILIVPGLCDSGPGHWQSWFEEQLPHARRVTQRDWAKPDLPAWSSAIRHELDRAPGLSWIVAHSFGCLAAVHACGSAARIAGVMLVAPAEPSLFGVESALPRARLGFPTLLVASENDNWMSLGRARFWALRWGADLVNAGVVGHINVASGHGPWPQGISLLKRLQKAPHAEPQAARSRAGLSDAPAAVRQHPA